jgi:hypothetical protein
VTIIIAAGHLEINDNQVLALAIANTVLCVKTQCCGAKIIYFGSGSGSEVPAQDSFIRSLENCIF